MQTRVRIAMAMAGVVVLLASGYACHSTLKHDAARAPKRASGVENELAVREGGA
jgi:hypothetical protein